MGNRLADHHGLTSFRRDEALEFLEPGSKNPSIDFSTGSWISALHEQQLVKLELFFIISRELYANAPT